MKVLDAASPLGRLDEPKDIASVVAFVGGDGASYLTTTTIFADGGLMYSGPGAVMDQFPRRLTALAITRLRMTIERNACATMIIFAQRARGMTSVGLNAVALVNAR